MVIYIYGCNFQVGIGSQVSRTISREQELVRCLHIAAITARHGKSDVLKLSGLTTNLSRIILSSWQDKHNHLPLL